MKGKTLKQTNCSPACTMWIHIQVNDAQSSNQIFVNSEGENHEHDHVSSSEPQLPELQCSHVILRSVTFRIYIYYYLSLPLDRLLMSSTFAADSTESQVAWCLTHPSSFWGSQLTTWSGTELTAEVKLLRSGVHLHCSRGFDKLSLGLWFKKLSGCHYAFYSKASRESQWVLWIVIQYVYHS